MAAAVAVCLVTTLCALWTFMPHGQRPPENLPVALRPGPDFDDAAAQSVLDTEGMAILTQAVNVVWAQGESPARVNDRIAARRLKIASGLLQVEFFSGATVVLEGPADLEIVSDMRCECRYGKLRVDVPPQAIGFTIGGGDVEVVDLGTEFAMRVGDGGTGEVHVLDGKVSVRRIHGDEERLLKHGQAIHFTDSGELAGFAYDGSSFVGATRLGELDRSSRSAARKLWLEHSARWANDPAIALYYNFENQQGTDRRLRGAIANAPPSSDGAIIGCRWTEGRFEGKQALEFKRTSDRVRVNLEGEFHSISLVVWLRVEGLDKWYSSLLLSDDFGTGKVHWQLTQKGLLKFSVGGSGSFPSPQILKPSDLGRWVQLATVYDDEAKEIRHYIDDTLVCSSTLALSTPLTFGPAEIGNWYTQQMSRKNAVRSLNGLIDEIAVFRRPLSQQEIIDSYQTGNPYP